MSENTDSSAPKKRRQGERMDVQTRVEVQAKFLEGYALSGVILTACEYAGIDRASVAYWREDEKFATQFTTAQAQADDRIRQEIRRRAVSGTEKTRKIYKNGELVAEETVREYSDTLLIFLAKSRMPEFREKIDFLVYVRRLAEQEGVDPDEAVREAERALGAPA